MEKLFKKLQRLQELLDDIKDDVEELLSDTIIELHEAEDLPNNEHNVIAYNILDERKDVLNDLYDELDSLEYDKLVDKLKQLDKEEIENERWNQG